MKKNNFFTFLLLIITVILLGSCASTDPYKYKDTRMVFKIDVDEPAIKNANRQFYLINKKITVLPFIDNRNFEKILFATDIPISLLFSNALYKDLYENSVFKNIEFAEENIYKNKTITFDENNFLILKNSLKTDAIIWGIIYEFNITISEDKTPQQYILTLHSRGDIKIMENSGIITYYHDFNKSRSYTFKTRSYFSYTIYDIKALGPYINNFCKWIINAEINHFIANSDKYIKGSMAIENLIPDVLTYPQENTKLYDISIITSAAIQKTFINGLGVLGGGLGGLFTGFYLSGVEPANLKAVLFGTLIGMPLGMLTGYFIADYFTNKIYESKEKEAIFYASKSRYNFTLFFPVLNFKL
jgi:hypothetical protein